MSNYSKEHQLRNYQLKPIVIPNTAKKGDKVRLDSGEIDTIESISSGSPAEFNYTLNTHIAPFNAYGEMSGSCQRIVEYLGSNHIADTSKMIKPLLADAKVGDLVKHSDNTYAQLTGIKPETGLEYKLGDWVEFPALNENEIGLVEYIDKYKYTIKSVAGSTHVVGIKSIIRKVHPKEVVVDLGNGIKGTVEVLPCDCCKDRVFILRISNDRFIEIPIDILTEPMKEIVMRLLQAQED